MQLTASFALLLASLASLAFAQQSNDTAAGLLQALRQNNLTTLANLVGNNSQAVLPLLTGSNKTVFGPTDEAFSQANLGANPSAEQLLPILRYHVINSTITDDTVPDDRDEHAILLTSLSGEPRVQLPNNRSQALVIAGGDDDNASIIETSRNVSFNLGRSATYQNVRLIPINNVLTPPTNLPATLQALNLTSLVQLAQQAQVASALNSTSALTLFAPNDAAITAAQSQVAAANDEQRRTILSNHVINGTAVYSTQLEGDRAIKSATSASGEMLSFEEDDDQLYVRSGDVRARIVRSDVLTSNGVVHVIDTVLLNNASNPAAASSAQSSAAAAAATNTQGISGGTNSGSSSNDNDRGGNGGNGAAGLAAGVATVGLVALSSAALLFVA